MSTTADLDSVRTLARLARLELSEEELSRLAPELQRILGAFEVLARHVPRSTRGPSTEASAVPPLARTREDVPLPSLDRTELLSAASEREDGFFSVPKTVGGER